MCGILGCVGVDDATTVLYEGLKRLEYRGYDSAGLAVGNGDKLAVEKNAGRVDALGIHELPDDARFGLAHTRWATHGPPTTENAHPHTCCAGNVAIAHNGIVENHAALREELEDRDHVFTSDTDTEVIAHLVEEAYDGDVTSALDDAVGKLKGSFAILAAHADQPGVIAATRQRSPLVLGLDDERTFVASDVVAFRAHTDEVIFLEDGDLATLTPDGYTLEPATPRPIEPRTVDWKLEEATKSGFPHFMLKEIHEQPRALSEALVGRTQLGAFEIQDALTLQDVAAFDEITFIACGSSYHAALAASRIFEDRCDIATRVELASEYEPLEALRHRALVVAVSQSGETADTLSALRDAKDAGFATLAITNVIGSTITREADGWIPIRAGPEISVAATKSFTSQLIVLHALALHVAHERRTLPLTSLEAEMEDVRDVPTLTRHLLDDTERFEEVGAWLADHEHAFVLGRGQGRALALEAALKIKEITYVHAEGLPAGELKHGTLALIEDGTPVIAMTPMGATRDRMVSSMEEVAARGAHVVAVSDSKPAMVEAGFDALEAPSKGASTFAYTSTVAGQLVAYHAAVARGTNVDKPRNLAKSVTVE